MSSKAPLAEQSFFAPTVSIKKKRELFRHYGMVMKVIRERLVGIRCV